MEDARVDEIARIAAKLSHELQSCSLHAVLYYLPINYKFFSRQTKLLPGAQEGYDTVVVTVADSMNDKDSKSFTLLLKRTAAMCNAGVSYFYRSGISQQCTVLGVGYEPLVEDGKQFEVVFCALNAMDELMRYRIDRRPPCCLYTVGRKNWRMYLNSVCSAVNKLIFSVGLVFDRVTLGSFAGFLFVTMLHGLIILLVALGFILARW